MRVEAEFRHLAIPCPACGSWEQDDSDGFAIGHLRDGRSAGPWYCDVCGQAFTLRRVGQGAECEILSGHKKEQTLVTLRIEQPATLVVEGIRITRPGEDDNDPDGNDRYFYEEHSCPENSLRRVVTVVTDDGNDDPHGWLRYVKTEPGEGE